MAVNIQKPEFNLRDKLNSLDYNKIPYNKMPHGTLIQTQLVTRIADASSTSTSWGDIDEMRFTCKFEDSTLLISANYYKGQTGNGNRVWWHSYGGQTRSYFMIQEFRGIINGIGDGGENWDLGDLS